MLQKKRFTQENAGCSVGTDLRAGAGVQGGGHGGEAGGNLGEMDTFPVLCWFHAHVCQSQQIICSAGVLCCMQTTPE